MRKVGQRTDLADLVTALVRRRTIWPQEMEPTDAVVRLTDDEELDVRRPAMRSVVSLTLLATACSSAADVSDPTTTQSPSTTATAQRGLICPTDVRAGAVYDYGDEPDPHAAEPEAAVEAFFGDRLPSEATLTATGSQVAVATDDTMVATVGLMSVPGGYVVSRYEACEGVIASG